MLQRPSKIIHATFQSDCADIVEDLVPYKDRICQLSRRLCRQRGNCTVRCQSLRRRQFKHCEGCTWPYIQWKTFWCFMRNTYGANDGMVIFTTFADLRTLNACDKSVMDGTFRSCTRFFMQLHVRDFCVRKPLLFPFGLCSALQRWTGHIRTFPTNCDSSMWQNEPCFWTYGYTTDLGKSAMKAIALVFAVFTHFSVAHT